MRTSEIIRKTAETDISLKLCVDGKGFSEINSGCGFLDHMLTLFAAHGRFDISLICKGDTNVDYHHTVEDIGIALGQAFDEALSDRRGIVRYGSMLLPMDEALIRCALDISGRSYISYDVKLHSEKVGDFDTELAEEFWQGFVRNCACTLHIRQLAGKNSHHIVEGIFKCVARALRQAVKIDTDFADDIPSTKGAI